MTGCYRNPLSVHFLFLTREMVVTVQGSDLGYITVL